MTSVPGVEETTYGAAALELRSISVPFGGGAGLSELSLSVAKGERMAIVGPSGVGKTTLLRAVAGLAPVSGGSVLVEGRDVTDLAPEKRDAVYLHQQPALFPHLSVHENVAFPLRVRSTADDVVRRRVSEVLAAVHLDALGARPVYALSGGQKHRVALARAVAAKPAVLLLDEPLSALDPALRGEVRGAIAAAQADYGATTLIVTHDLEDVGALADRVAVMIGGRVAQVATPAELFSRPATMDVARFLGIYQELEGRLRADGAVECALGVVPGSHPGAGREVTVAFRAEALRLRAVSASGDGARGRIVGVNHRPRGTTLSISVEHGGGQFVVEAAAGDAMTFPPAGEQVTVWLEPGAVRVFPLAGR